MGNIQLTTLKIGFYEGRTFELIVRVGLALRPKEVLSKILGGVKGGVCDVSENKIGGSTRLKETSKH
jgi:hypothetical protein